MKIANRFVLLAIISSLVGCSSDSESPAADVGPVEDGTDDSADGDVVLPDTDLEQDTEPDVVPTEDAAPSDSALADIDAGIPPEGHSLSATQSPNNSLAFYVDWAAPADTDMRLVEVDCPTAVQDQFTLGADDTSGEFFLMGLVDGERCVISLTTEEGTVRTPVTGGPLPEYLPEFEVESTGETQPGWTLVNLNNAFHEQPLSVALFDELGRYRWYHWVSDEAGSDNEIAVVDGGVLIGGRSTLQAPQRVDWRGRQLWSFPWILMHHDIRLIDENTIRFLADEDYCGTGFRDGGIKEYDVVERETTWEFHLCDFYLPEDGPWPDWSHTNTIGDYGETGILLSSREQHTIFLVDRERGEIDWSIGLHGSIELGENAEFWRQHAPEEVGDGNVLLFDNGLEGTREFSRAIELAIDADAGTAELVWEFVPDPPIAAYIWGDADRQPNGNTLITFGVRNLAKRTHLYEVDADAEVVWHATFPEGWGVYRSDRVEPPPAIHFYED